ncbi:cytochrome P450 [Actinocorallia sp. API 0066]|uniref:cytochrome P450 n=1 Tax=Actinocorallia sp. API 0066 TaxID=2896846 RepID=UPI001E388CA1|nr:cytochrome P450 [Actinocorallia sp. API 0066]MCD0450484.1 cytochrome P450 [Actinocorallia sp. API 0066]
MTELDFSLLAAAQPVGTTAEIMDGVREEHRAFYSAYGKGFWVLTRYEDILAAFQDPELFSSASVNALDPEPRYRWIPEMLDPPEHTGWRRLLRPHFTPAAVKAREARVREHCAGLVAGFAASGGCDFVADFAVPFPAVIFLELMGLPVERLDTFLAWERAILHGPPSANAARMAAMGEVTAMFAELIAHRRAHPADDLISDAVTWTLDGAPIPEADLLAMCLLLFMAGLDTVTSQLSYAFWHLATHPADQKELRADPDLIPSAVEELTRAYSIVLPGRKVTRDAEFAGCPMKAGDMVMLPLTSANRDPRAFTAPARVDLRRPHNRHLAFAAGPHRCLGAHLARLELRVALEEWHRVLPPYALNRPNPTEHTYGLQGLNTLPLTWS